MRTIVASAIFLSLAISCPAGILQVLTEPKPDKSGYHLFNPTPPNFMRELSTDRPDKTESAYTVDAGHFQIESDLVTYTYDREGDLRLDDWTAGGLNLKAGLLNWMDVQVVIEAYRHIRVRENGTVFRASGFGDTTVRLKMNLWGNDGGTTAFALMPLVKFPTSSDGLGNGAVDGGIIFPLAISLPADWGMGMMLEVDLNEDADGRDHHAEFIQTISFGRDIIGKLAGYLEFFSQVSEEAGSEWIATVDFGFTYAISDDIRLDAGLNIGVTDAADDLNPFVGLTLRF
jgi:hypothetical protein